jgi:diaminopimelate epimerase
MMNVVKCRQMMKFFKYHGLGNDYIVLQTNDGTMPTVDEIRLICQRNYGVGGDGILLSFGPRQSQQFGLKIFNPDGSEAEKSGNGLRIFSRYLWDLGLVSDKPFDIHTKGGIVQARVHDGGKTVTVEMGQVSFRSGIIPVTGSDRDVLNEDIQILDRKFKFCAATVGNPHCVIPVKSITRDEVVKFGPIIERDNLFPNRTNVQFMRVIDRNNIYIEIWERGAGYTLASGSSSCAAAAVAHKLGFCDKQITVLMPGGRLQISIGDDWNLTMTGPVTKVCEGTISPEMFV